MSEETYTAKKIEELKLLLREQGLPVSGPKKDLVARLLQGQGAAGLLIVSESPTRGTFSRQQLQQDHRQPEAPG